MRYTEHPVPPSLDGWVAAIWELENDGSAQDWISQDAVPDGCVELIFRRAGQSAWGTKQPRCFVAGIAEAAAQLQFSADSAFSAIRFWPWAWNRIAQPRCPQLIGHWEAFDENAALAPIAELAQSKPDALVALFAGEILPDISSALLRAESVADIAALSGQSPRQIQRWFAREIGMPPRRYIRLLRFRAAVIGLGDSSTSLAHHAADSGYADQAHMTRDFKRLAGTAPGKARRTVKGPFLASGDHRP